MNPDISITLALIAGLASFLSPCVLPLVPVYVSLISGASVKDLQNSETASRLRWVVFTNSFTFVIGFSIVFMTLGVAAGLLGTKLSSSLPLITRAAGVLVIVFGLHMAGVLKIPFLYQDTRSQASTGKGPIGSFLMGLAFAAGWSPCVGPILAGILVLAANKQTILQATGLLGIYSVGLAIPFLLTALAISQFLQFLNKFKKHLHKVEVTAGVSAALGLTLSFLLWYKVQGGPALDLSLIEILRARPFYLFSAGITIFSAVSRVRFF